MAEHEPTPDGPTDPGQPEPRREEAAKTTSSEEKLRRLRSRPPLAQDRYRFESEIGRGGMGAVLRVRDLDLGRNLAMKVILGKDSGAAAGDTPAVEPQVLQRFLDEAQITGQLDHPGVVPVHELGLDDQGRVYFTMRLVRGEIADEVFLAARQGRDGWTQTRALEIILKVCDTMAFAHKKGVLHRDLKPSNVMVGKFGEVYVMDWGLAKVLGEQDRRDLRIRPQSTATSRLVTDRSKDEADSDSPLLTMDGAVVGTPSYMSPQQAEGLVELLDQRADVYAVGAMLYQLLTGRQPYVNPGARVSPYVILAAVQAGPPVVVHKIDKTVPAELVAVCEKAMARDLAQRYPDIRALADDLRAYLEKRVVKAYRTGPIAELSMWVRRNKGLAVAAAAAVLALVGGIVSTTVFALRADERAEEVAALNAGQKKRITEASWGAFHQADRLLSVAETADSTTRQSNVREGLLLLVRALQFDPDNRVAWERLGWEACARSEGMHAIDTLLLSHENSLSHVEFSRDGKHLVTASEDSTARVWDAVTGKLLFTLKHQGGVRQAKFSGDGTRVVTASRDKSAKVWDVVSGKMLLSLEHQDQVWHAEFSPDGTRVVTASLDKTAKMWDAVAGKLLFSLENQQGMWHAEFSPDGTRVATDNGLWDAITGSLQFSLPYTAYAASFCPDGTRIITSSWLDGKGGVRVYDATTGKSMLSLEHPRSVWRAELSPDGTRVVTACDDKTARLWDAATGKQLFSLKHSGMVRHATFSPDGMRVVTASLKDNTAKVWKVATGELLFSFLHMHGVDCAAFSPDGAQVATASFDKTAKLWDLRGGAQWSLLLEAPGIEHAEFSPDGTRVLTVSQDEVALWDAVSGKRHFALDHQNHVDLAAFSPDGSRLVTAAWDDVRLWDAVSGKLLFLLKHQDNVEHAEFSPDGTRVITASRDKTARVWNAMTGKQLFSLDHQKSVDLAAFSPDGSRLVTAAWDDVRLWDAVTGKLELSLPHGGVTHATFNPNGKCLVTASRSNDEAHAWDWITGRELFALRGFVGHAAFNPEGTRAITVSGETARIWEMATGRELLSLRHRESVEHGAFSPDGRLVITASRDKTAKLWDAVTGKLLFSFEHTDLVRHAEFSLDGTRVVTASLDKTAKVWDLNLARDLRFAGTPAAVEQSEALAQLLTGQILSPEGELLTRLSSEREQRARLTLQHILATPCALTPLARWLTTHGHDAPASPGANITCWQRAEILIDHGGPISVHEAYDLCPSHPLVHIALAAHEKAPEARDQTDVDKQAAEASARKRREFLRDYDLERLPTEAALCARAADMLVKQDDKPRALIASSKALAIDPKNETALRVKAEASR